MIQRKQTLFLMIVLVLTVTVFFLLNFEVLLISKKLIPNYLSIEILTYFFLIPAILSLITILLFKRRPIQIGLCKLISLVNLFILVFLGGVIYNSITFDSNVTLSLLIIPAFFFLNLMFSIQASKGIKSDEEMIRKIDRIR